MNATPETDLEEATQTQRFGCRMVKSDFARKLELRNRALMRALADLEDLSRDMRTTRKTLRDRLCVLLQANDKADPADL